MPPEPGDIWIRVIVKAVGPTEDSVTSLFLQEAGKAEVYQYYAPANCLSSMLATALAAMSMQLPVDICVHPGGDHIKALYVRTPGDWGVSPGLLR